MTTIHLFYPLLFIFAIIVTFILAWAYKDKLNFKKDIHFKDKDVETVTEAFKRIGEVRDGSQNEIILNMQNVENNKEIHNNNLEIEDLKKVVMYLKNENGNLRADYAVLSSRFDHLVKAIGREV